MNPCPTKYGLLLSQNNKTKPHVAYPKAELSIVTTGYRHIIMRKEMYLSSNHDETRIAVLYFDTIPKVAKIHFGGWSREGRAVGDLG